MILKLYTIGRCQTQSVQLLRFHSTHAIFDKCKDTEYLAHRKGIVAYES